MVDIRGRPIGGLQSGQPGG